MQSPQVLLLATPRSCAACVRSPGSASAGRNSGRKGLRQAGPGGQVRRRPQRCGRERAARLLAPQQAPPGRRAAAGWPAAESASAPHTRTPPRCAAGALAGPCGPTGPQSPAAARRGGPGGARAQQARAGEAGQGGTFRGGGTSSPSTRMPWRLRSTLASCPVRARLQGGGAPATQGWIDRQAAAEHLERVSRHCHGGCGAAVPAVRRRASPAASCVCARVDLCGVAVCRAPPCASRLPRPEHCTGACRRFVEQVAATQERRHRMKWQRACRMHAPWKNSISLRKRFLLNVAPVRRASNACCIV